MLGDKCALCVQKVEHQHGVSTLRVTPFRDTDFGDYNCKVKNKLGFQHIMIKLHEDKSKSKCFRLQTLCFFMVFSLLSVTENPMNEFYPLCSSFDVGTVASIAFLSALQFSNLTNLFTTSLPSENTQCQQDRILSRDPRLKLEFLPRCNADGSYHVIQCSVHLSKCWCVDKSGHKVADAVDGDKGKHCQSKPKGKPGS